MNEIASLFLDIVLIGLLITGIVYAMRLSKQMAGLRASRADMERFVVDFSMTVQRAEAGVRGLKQAARSGGDDLEQQIDKAHKIRDELQFLVESADQIATRLSDVAGAAARALSQEQAPPDQPATKPVLEERRSTVTLTSVAETPKPVSVSNEKKTRDRPATAAERELLQALEKAG